MQTKQFLAIPLSAVAVLGFLLWRAPLITTAQASQKSSGPCAQCHAEALSQPATRMAHALETAEQSDILICHPILTATYGKYSYRIERKGNQSLYSVTDGTTTVTLPIRWALGASFALGQTYILEKDGQLYESRMSWFQELNGLGPTLGNAGYVPTDVNDAAGRLISRDEKVLCFGCHATNAAHGTQLTLDQMTPGCNASAATRSPTSTSPPCCTAKAAAPRRSRPI